MLNSHGFEATTAQEESRRGETDKDQLSFATERGLCLLTHNRDDFARLAGEYVASDRHHYGIIIATRKPVQQIVRRILLILNQVTADEICDQVRSI